MPPNCTRKSCDYVLIIYINEIADHNYAEAKCAHQVEKQFIQTLQVALCVRSKQPRTIKIIICDDTLTHLRRNKVQSPAKQFKELFYWGLLLLCTEFTLFCFELHENCIYLNQSELSNFFMYLIRTINDYFKRRRY